MDLIAFHPMDGVVAAAAFAIKSILQQLPEGRGDPAPRGEQGSWDPQRPLTFLSMCGPLTCLGLDPMADDPTSEVDSVPTSPYMSSGAEQPRAPLRVLVLVLQRVELVLELLALRGRLLLGAALVGELVLLLLYLLLRLLHLIFELTKQLVLQLQFVEALLCLLLQGVLPLAASLGATDP